MKIFNFFKFKTKNKQENIYKFLSGEEPDKYGRNIKEIWGYDNKLLEKSHNYIQRLFPTTEESIFEKAPVVDLKTDKKYINNPKIKENMIKSFKLMLNFYGFEYNDDKIIDKQEQKHWISKGNHNYLRITRIITSLKIFGLEKEAILFYEELLNLSHTEKIDEKSLKYWENAIK